MRIVFPQLGCKQKSVCGSRFTGERDTSGLTHWRRSNQDRAKLQLWSGNNFMENFRSKWKCNHLSLGYVRITCKTGIVTREQM